MVQFDKDKARSHGQTVGLVVLLAILVALEVIHSYLRWPLGEELSTSLLIVVGLFAIALFDPIATRYASFETRRYCLKHGHLLKNETADDSRPYVVCTRCYMVMIQESHHHLRES